MRTGDVPRVQATRLLCHIFMMSNISTQLLQFVNIFILVGLYLRGRTYAERGALSCLPALGATAFALSLSPLVTPRLTTVIMNNELIAKLMSAWASAAKSGSADFLDRPDLGYVVPAISKKALGDPEAFAGIIIHALAFILIYIVSLLLLRIVFFSEKTHSRMPQRLRLAWTANRSLGFGLGIATGVFSLWATFYLVPILAQPFFLTIFGRAVNNVWLLKILYQFNPLTHILK